MENTTQQRPRSVLRAVYLLCAAGLLDVLVAWLRWDTLLGPCLGLAAIVALSIAAMRGHAWARGIFLVWCALRFMATLGCGLLLITRGPVLLLETLSTVLLIVACELLFRRPAFVWFSETGAERYRRRLGV